MQQTQPVTGRRSETGAVAPPGRNRPSAAVVAVVAALAAVVLGAVGVVAATSGSDLPRSVAGMPRLTEPDADVDRAVAAVVERLESEAAVARVAVGRYGSDGGSVVVMLVAPRTPLGEEAAGELTARVMDVVGADGRGAPGAGAGTSVVTQDGAALLTCATRRPGAATCLTVDPEHAVLVLSSGVPGSATTLAEAVRADVLTHPR